MCQCELNFTAAIVQRKDADILVVSAPWSILLIQDMAGIQSRMLCSTLLLVGLGGFAGGLDAADECCMFGICLEMVEQLGF
jgi:hypothetical protein